MSETYGVPYREVGRLRIDEFALMLRELPNAARRRQAPIAQLTWVVAAAVGNKTNLEDWYTGRAIREVENKTYNPPHLERALQVGLKLGVVSDEAFITLRQLRE